MTIRAYEEINGPVNIKPTCKRRLLAFKVADVVETICTIGFNCFAHGRAESVERDTHDFQTIGIVKRSRAELIADGQKIVRVDAGSRIIGSPKTHNKHFAIDRVRREAATINECLFLKGLQLVKIDVF